MRAGSYAQIGASRMGIARPVIDHCRMRTALMLIVAVAAPAAFAKLPPLSDEEQAKVADAKAKSAWTEKVGAYQTCLAIDRTAQTYRRSQAAAGKEVPPAASTPSCVDPGPAPSSKPLEAAGAHSPPETANTPPSGRAPQASNR